MHIFVFQRTKKLSPIVSSRKTVLTFCFLFDAYFFLGFVVVVFVVPSVFEAVLMVVHWLGVVVVLACNPSTPMEAETGAFPEFSGQLLWPMQ